MRGRGGCAHEGRPRNYGIPIDDTVYSVPVGNIRKIEQVKKKAPGRDDPGACQRLPPNLSGKRNVRNFLKKCKKGSFFVIDIQKQKNYIVVVSDNPPTTGGTRMTQITLSSGWRLTITAEKLTAVTGKTKIQHDPLSFLNRDWSPRLAADDPDMTKQVQDAGKDPNTVLVSDTPRRKDLLSADQGVLDAILSETAERRKKRDTERAETQAAMDARKAADQALIDEAQKGLPALLAQIPEGAVRVEYKYLGCFDGYDTHDHFADGEKLGYSDFEVVGWVKATRPNAQEPFYSEAVAYITREKLDAIRMKRHKTTMDRQARLEAEKARHEAVMAKVRSVEIGRCRTRPGSDGDDHECPVTVTAQDGTVYRATFVNMFDAGLWSPGDWPAEVLAAAREKLPAEMKTIRM
jgi:hypothetical protein